MQDFSSRMGWTKGALFLSAILLAVAGILCFAMPDIMPEALHKPILPESLSMGTVLIAVAIAITGISQLAAFAKVGGSRNVSGFLILSGIFELFIAVALLTDTVFGTVSYEWVCAVLFGLWGACLFLEAVCASRLIGYKGWGLQLIIGLVEIALALGVVLDSSNSLMLSGVALIVAAVEVILIPLMSGSIKVADKAPVAA